MSQTLPDITKDFSEWYNEVIYQAELADLSPVRGSVVIRPYGFALWENIKDELNKKIIASGTQNASFPLLIPLSFFHKEAEHVEGFAPELAVVTHAGGKELEEPLAIRPTSETMMHYMFAKWIKSWRDLPMKMNQWCNVVRWEKRTRPFLRTSEFFWQEGHTAHATAQEAQEMAEHMWREYVSMYEDYLAIPVIAGKKSESEKFAGADTTYTVEGCMPDGKALQMCTSHLISQNFAKSFNMQYQDKAGSLAYPYLTSWGFTTRSVGAVVMVHGDQKGVVMPPKVAPIQVVIIPIFKKDEEKNEVLKQADALAASLKKENIRVHIDAAEHQTPGAKFYAWELKGVPLRVEIGPRDIAKQQVMMADRLGLGKQPVAFDALVTTVQNQLTLIHTTLFERAQERMKAQWHKKEQFKDFAQDLEQNAGFYQVGWCQERGCEEKLKEIKATIRCLLPEKTSSTCFACGKPSAGDIVVAKAY
ncbi:MAG: proline--tRNA ligase [Candidatus Babeliales bacterium]